MLGHFGKSESLSQTQTPDLILLFTAVYRHWEGSGRKEGREEESETEGHPREQYTKLTDFVSLFLGSAGTMATAPTTTATTVTTTTTTARPRLRRIPCSSNADCSSAEGSQCDLLEGACDCKPDYPVTDTRRCYKGKDHFPHHEGGTLAIPM